MVRRLFTPKWIAIHLLVLTLVFTMANLGLWQLHRLDDKRAFNALVTARTRETVKDLAVMWPVDTVDPNTIAEWSRVRMTGMYVPSKSVTIINRSQDGVAGYDSVVPLKLEDGRTVLINRGFVPLATAEPAPPEGSVTITGYVRASQKRSALGPIDSVDVASREFQRFDVPLIAKRLPGEVLPFFVQSISEDPSPPGQWPSPVRLPELSEGPHLSYAFQWFFFCLVAITAWVIVVRRRLAETVSDRPAPTGTSA